MNELFSTRLKDLRKSFEMTQGCLAKKIGVGRTTIVEYEKGVIYPSHERLIMLSKIFDVSLDYLTGNDAPQEEKERPEMNDLRKTLFAAYGKVEDHLTEDNVDDLIVLMNNYAERNQKKDKST